MEACDADIVLSRKGLIKEDAVEILLERIPVSCLDHQVHLQSCKKYFTNDGWLKQWGGILCIIVADALAK